MIAVTAPPPTSVAHAASTLVQRTGAAGTEHLAAFSAGLLAQTAVGVAPRATAPRGTAGATLTPGQIVVLKMPNAHADTAMTGDRPRLGVSGAPARVVILGHGGVVLADQNVGDGATIEIARGAERIVAIGQGTQAEAHAGLVGWHAGLQMAYAGWSTGIAPGCVVRSAGEPLRTASGACRRRLGFRSRAREGREHGDDDVHDGADHGSRRAGRSGRVR